jgi:hypothetical protein
LNSFGVLYLASHHRHEKPSRQGSLSETCKPTASITHVPLWDDVLVRVGAVSAIPV